MNEGAELKHGVTCLRSRQIENSLLKRQPPTRMSLIKPSLAETVERKQAATKETHDKGKTSVRHFAPGDHVMVRSFRGKEKWDCGVILQALGPVGYNYCSSW